jgi:hypothetical protein
VKRLLQDPGFWFLLLMNGWLIYYYVEHPGESGTIFWIYWLQSVLIGLLTFTQILMVKHPDPNSLKMNNAPVTRNNMGCAAFFFLFHYGMFHFIYGIFLLIDFNKGTDWKLVLLAGGAFLLESTRQLYRMRQISDEKNVNMGGIFFVPYIRTIPMHMAILFPSFLGMSISVFFLLLKTLADAGMYIITSKKYGVTEKTVFNTLRKLAKKYKDG